MDNSYQAMAALRDLPTQCPSTTPAVQAALLMLRMCVLPKATHLLRALSPDVLSQVAEKFDALQQRCNEKNTMRSTTAIQTLFVCCCTVCLLFFPPNHNNSGSTKHYMLAPFLYTHYVHSVHRH